ncbi:MAG: DUF4386 domain-containing protein [Ferruginibacter sp.]
MVETTSQKTTARIAGLLYLLIVLTGIFSLMYVPSRLLVTGNATLTYQHIVSSETLFRLWIVGGLLCYAFFLFLPMVLYKLLRQVNEDYAKLMVLLAIMSVPVFFLNVQNQFTILSLTGEANNHYGLTVEQLQSQVMLYLTQYDNGLRIVHIFSGLWLFPFGYLVFRSGFLPKFLGALLMAGCFGYLVNFLGNTLVPGYSATGISFYISLPASIGEIGICLWLLIVGVRSKKNG